MGMFEKVLIGIAAGVCLVTMVLVPLGAVAFLGSLLAVAQNQYLLAGAAAILGISALVFWYLRRQKRAIPARRPARVAIQSEPQAWHRRY